MNDPAENKNIMIINDPIRLIDGIEIHEFHTSLIIKSYLLQVDNRNYSLTRELFILVNLIDGRKSLVEIAKEYSILRNREYSPEDVATIVQNFLVPIGILQGADSVKPESNKKYLRFRLPFISGKIIKILVKPLYPLFNKYIFVTANVIIFIIHSLIFLRLGMREIEDFATSPNMFFIASLITFLSCLIHEFGHATATSFYNAKPGAIGFGIYLYIPVFYSDVSDIWKLDRYKRAIVDYAGIYFQFIFNCFLFCLFVWTGSKLFLFSMIFISIHSLSNMNPFFRFDGYWLLSDLLGIPNLRSKVNELLVYYRNKINRTNCSKPKFLIGLEPTIRNVLIVYMIASNLFFIYILAKLALFFPSLLSEYPDFVYSVVGKMKQAISIQDLKSIGGTIFEFILHSVPIAFILYVIYSPIRTCIKYLLAFDTRKRIQKAQLKERNIIL